MSDGEFLTIITDASRDPETGGAGWGGWARAGSWPSSRLMSGQFKARMEGINEAEICAIANAMHELKQAGLLSEIRAFMVQSDSLFALQCLLHHIKTAVPAKVKDKKDTAVTRVNLRTVSKTSRAAAKKIEELAEGRKIYLRHVKGHQGNEKGRSWVNCECDRRAKHERREAAKRLRSQPNFDVQEGRPDGPFGGEDRIRQIQPSDEGSGGEIPNPVGFGYGSICIVESE